MFCFRFEKFMNLTSNSKKRFEPHHLPPTDRAAFYHGLRTHLQIMKWMLVDEEEELSPSDWGWKENNGCLLPVTTDLDVAPVLLKKVIRCKCKTTGKNFCGTNLCSCRKHGLPCLSSCSGCRGEDCMNCEEVFSYL